MPKITLHFSDGAEMNLFHSISIALPKWVRADLPDFKKESNVGYGLIQVLLKDYPPPPSPLGFLFPWILALIYPKQAYEWPCSSIACWILLPSNNPGMFSFLAHLRGGSGVFCSYFVIHLLSTCWLQTVLIFMCSLCTVFN